MNPLKLGNNREVFWDDYLINTSLTGAYLRQHPPRIEENVITLDRPWEGDGCIYFSCIHHNGVYRMYYLGLEVFEADMSAYRHSNVSLCCIESTDGIHWTRPELDLHSFPGYDKTNILLTPEDAKAVGLSHFDNFHVFIDENPDCPADERIKATSSGGAMWDGCPALFYWTSVDGYRFNLAGTITRTGRFDTQNVAFWSHVHRKYFCYVRDFHNIEEGSSLNLAVRDIRYLTSRDFKTWTEPQMVDFGSAEDIPLYTNAASVYARAPQIMMGMPSRYVERFDWTGNYDQLTGAEARKQRMRVSRREGLVVTDCVLMTSRDGVRWNRWDEAWMTPGIERDHTWVYGDCYPSPSVLQTKSSLPGAPDELSFYVFERHISQHPTTLRRYTCRLDGLISYRADYAPQKLVTKPILYEGGQLSLNFSTSARGYIYVTVHCGKETVKSCELFGDTIDRIVPFEGDLTPFVGKEIILEFVMSDADLYSMQFIK